MSFIMAMPVKQTFVVEFFSSAKALWRQVVNFNDIRILKEQATPTTFPLLFTQQGPFDPIKHGMSRESLAPIEKISVIAHVMRNELSLSNEVASTRKMRK
jgi:hypothetical protein